MREKRKPKKYKPKPKIAKAITPGLADMAAQAAARARRKPAAPPSAADAEQAKADREALGKAFPSVKVQ